MNKKTISFLACALFALAGTAHASAIITDGNVSLGVDDYGQLNVYGGVASVSGETAVGVRWIADSGGQFESTSHGCLCEGWGVAASGTSGWANNNFGSGVSGLGLTSFSSTATTAESVTTMGNLQITHSFALSASDNLMQVTVTITNTGAVTATDIEYRRTMDWDADPTPFDEYVTINSGTSTNLLSYSNDGFTTSDPFDGMCSGSSLWPVGCIEDTDFADLGPADHGANFDFGFGDLLAGESVEFSIFYGGAESTAAALGAIGTVGAEVYSFGRSGCDADDNGFADFEGCGYGSDLTPTYIFAFSGVGGDPIVDVPEPGTLFLLGAGLFGLAFARRRNKV